MNCDNPKASTRWVLVAGTGLITGMPIEAMYAAKAIGWEKIICVYNTDYGDLTDLPFDLRQRRPLFYSLTRQNKSKVKNDIVKKFLKTIDTLSKKGLLFNEVQDLLKKDVDTQILTLTNWLSTIVFGYHKIHK